MGTQVSIGTFTLKSKMSLYDLFSDTLAISLGDPEVSIWKTIGLTFGGVVLIEGSHESIISLRLESIWDVSLVGVVSTEAVHPVWVWLLLWWLIVIVDQPGVELGLDLNVLFITIRGVGVRVTVRLFLIESVELVALFGNFDSLDLVDLSDRDKTQKGCNSNIFH